MRFFLRMPFWSVLSTSIISPSSPAALALALARSDRVCARCEHWEGNGGIWIRNIQHPTSNIQIMAKLFPHYQILVAIENNSHI